MGSTASFGASPSWCITAFSPARALVARDDLRTAMSDDRARHALFRAPTKLRANGRVANQRVASLSHERACQGRAVADVNLHAFERCDAIMDEEEIRPVKDVCPA